MDKRQALTLIIDGVFSLAAGVLTLIVSPTDLGAVLKILGLAQPLVVAIVLYFALDNRIARLESKLDAQCKAQDVGKHSALR